MVRTGPLATIQDLGRPGYAAVGVSPSGAADRQALRLANRLVGNDEAAAGIEVTMGGLCIRGEAPTLVALTGAACPVTTDGRPGRHAEPIRLDAGSELTLGTPEVGLRTYLGVRGGLDVVAVLGSRATDTMSGLGPAVLRDGSRVPVGAATPEPPAVDVVPLSSPADQVHVRVMLGPRDDWFTESAVRALLTTPWTVSNDADRVGIRLDGPRLERARRGELPSEGCVRGALQVSPDGRPTLLLADHPVTGGYPVIAVVVDADTDQVAQARPGSAIRFGR